MAIRFNPYGDPLRYNPPPESADRQEIRQFVEFFSGNPGPQGDLQAFQERMFALVDQGPGLAALPMGLLDIPMLNPITDEFFGFFCSLERQVLWAIARLDWTGSRGPLPLKGDSLKKEYFTALSLALSLRLKSFAFKILATEASGSFEMENRGLYRGMEVYQNLVPAAYSQVQWTQYALGMAVSYFARMTSSLDDAEIFALQMAKNKEDLVQFLGRALIGYACCDNFDIGKAQSLMDRHDMCTLEEKGFMLVLFSRPGRKEAFSSDFW